MDVAAQVLLHQLFDNEHIRGIQVAAVAAGIEQQAVAAAVCFTVLGGTARVQKTTTQKGSHSSDDNSSGSSKTGC